MTWAFKRAFYQNRPFPGLLLPPLFCFLFLCFRGQVGSGAGELRATDVLVSTAHRKLLPCLVLPAWCGEPPQW